MLEKKCTKCKKSKSQQDFGNLSVGKDGKNPRCKKCERQREQEYRKKNPDQGKKAWTRYNKKKRNEQPELVKFYSVKGSAKKRGIEFSLQPSDIVFPEVCPILGIKLLNHGKGGPQPNSPSLDRLDPSKGYIPGNVNVISNKANIIKSNATSEEVLAVGNWMKEKGL